METGSKPTPPTPPRALVTRTYVAIRPMQRLARLIDHPEKYLVDIHAHPQEAVEVWTQRRRQARDKDWGEGFLEFIYDGQQLIGPDTRDELVALWDYLLTLVEDYQRQGRGMCTYPDSPVPIVLQDRKGATYFTIDRRTVPVEAQVFIRDLVDDAEAFFHWMHQHLGEDFPGEATTIADIRTRLATGPDLPTG